MLRDDLGSYCDLGWLLGGAQNHGIHRYHRRAPHVGSAMTHHPHIHMIVPGGGISLDGQRWISSRPAFLLPVRVLGLRALPLPVPYPADRLHRAGRLTFFGTQAGLADHRVFLRHLSPVRKKRCRVDGDVAAPIPHRPDVRDSASGSSRERFARGGVTVDDPGRRQRVSSQDFIEAAPSEPALPISPRQPFPPNPPDLIGEPA